MLFRLTIGLLETVTLKITERETLFEKSLFGRTSWQIKLPTSEFQGTEPKWRMIEKRNSGIVDDLIWLSSDHNRSVGKQKQGIEATSHLFLYFNP